MTAVEDVTKQENEDIKELKRRFEGEMKPEMYEDNHTFYRFLKARDFNLDQAEYMLRNHLAWRKKFDVDSILTNFTPKEALEKYFPGSFIGADKEGCPVRYCSIGNLDPKGIRKAAKFIPDIVKHVIQMIETDYAYLNSQAKKLGKPITGGVYIADFKNFPFAVASDKKTIEHAIYLAKMYQDNYPELLKRVYVINVSSYFTIFYNFIKIFIVASIMKKVRLFSCTDNYQEVLLDVMNADDLPAFLGGNKKDPDGDPLCRSFITHVGPVPQKYFVNKTRKGFSRSEGVTKLIVSRSSFSEVTLEVTEPGSIIEWEFETKSRDIGFGLFYKEVDGDLSKTLEVVPLQRLDTEEFSETGMHTCEKTGTYTLLFDNSYSWLRSKVLYYRVVVTNSKELEEGLETVD